MKDAKGHGSDPRGGVGPSKQTAIGEFLNAMRNSVRGLQGHDETPVARHAQVSVNTEPPTHDNLDAELAGRNLAQRQRETGAQSTMIRGNPGGTGTEDVWADIKHEHYKAGTE